MFRVGLQEKRVSREASEPDVGRTLTLWRKYIYRKPNSCLIQLTLISGGIYRHNHSLRLDFPTEHFQTVKKTIRRV